MPHGSVTDYLERAREIAALADRKSGPEKKRLLEIAAAWLQLADDAALAARVSSESPLHAKSA